MVTETWLKDSISDNEILPYGYNIIGKDRANGRRGGGVMLAIKGGVKFSKITSGTWCDLLEIIAIELICKNSKKCLMSVCYRPPNCDLGEWFGLFTSFLQSTEHYEKVYITGDLNFPELTWDSHLTPNIGGTVSTDSMEFYELIRDFYLQQMNLHPTRLNHILDLVFTNCPETVSNVSSVPAITMDLFTDHKLLFFDISLQVKSNSSDIRTVFNYRLADWDTLFDELSRDELSATVNVAGDGDGCSGGCDSQEHVYDSACNITKNVDEDLQRWTNVFLDIVGRHIPTKTIRRRGTPPWFDSEVKHHIKKKETARRRAKKTSRPNHWERFRQLRRSTKKLVSEKRKQFYNTLPILLKSNPKRFWSVFKSVSKSSNIPNKMNWTHNETTTTADNPTDIANMFNKYFLSMFKPPLTNNEYEHHRFVAADEEICDPLNDIRFSNDEVQKILTSLDVDKATGPDKIPAILLRTCAPYISLSLCSLFNKCLANGKFPAAWKISNVTPIPKGGAAKQITNYRPISLLSITSKVLERCVYNRLVEHVSGHLHHLQFGFLKGKSTTDQLLRVLHQIGESLDKRVQTDSIFLDFAKAFDRVDHRLLVKKLRQYGISGSLLQWFENYLSDRYQRVTVLGETSDPVQVLSGVPQGSILGPLLFLIHINDLPTVATSSSATLFADDTKCFRSIRRPDNVHDLQRDLDNICEWCSVWRMDLNQSKCSHLQITRNIKPIQSSYHVMDAPVEKVSVQKDLGLLVSSNLKWNAHVAKVSAKASKMLSFVRRSCHGIQDPRVRRSMYVSLVRSNLGYSSQVWAPQAVYLIQTIERIQRRATKFILSLPFRSSYSYKERLMELGLLPVSYWHEYLDLVYLWKQLKNPGHSYFSIKQPNRVTRSTVTTTELNLNIPKTNTLTFQNSYYCRTPRIFNCLPSDLRDPNLSIPQFKSKLYKHFKYATEHVYDVQVPQTFKTVCVKCHSCRPLSSLLTKLCC